MDKNMDPVDRLFGWFFVVVGLIGLASVAAFIYLAVAVAQWIGRQ